MKRSKLVVGASLVVLLISACAMYQSTSWNVKEGYEVKVFRNAQTQFPIYFKGLKAEITFDESQPEKSTIKATIDATTVDTGVELMTVHAKEEDVLHTDKYPTITFQSKSIKKSGNAFEATGNLTMKGVKKEIKLPFTFVNNVFMGKFSILASDYNITRQGAVPSGEIKIELTIPVEKK